MTIRRRKDRGWWEYTIELERGPDGRRRQARRGGYATKKLAAEAEAEERVTLAQRGALPFDEKTMTLATYMLRWLDSRKPPRLEASAYQRYEELARIYIVPAIGTVELRKLRALDVEAAIATVAKAGRSPTTAARVYSCLHAALNQAVRWRLVAQNVAAYVDKPRTAKPDLYVPTLEEARKLLVKADETRFGIVYWMAALTGCREGELLALRWHNVDVAAGLVRVTGSARRLTGQGVVLKDTKTHRSRAVALPEPAVWLLSAQRERIAEAKAKHPHDYADNDLVFADDAGRPIDGTWVGKVWRRDVAAKVGLPTVRVHDLRHFHVSYLLSKGISPKVIADRVGHQSAGFTMDKYGHVTAASQTEAATVMGEGLQ